MEGGAEGWGSLPLCGGVRAPAPDAGFSSLLSFLPSEELPGLVRTGGLIWSPSCLSSDTDVAGRLRQGGFWWPGRGECREGARPDRGSRETTGCSGLSHRGLLPPDGAPEPRPRRGTPFLVPDTTGWTDRVGGAFPSQSSLAENTSK